MKNKRGFTIIEALVTTTILALLAAFAIPGFLSSLERGKIRNMVDLISQSIMTAKSEALRRNIKIYLEVVAGDICVGTTSGGCDIRKEPLSSGINVSATKLVLSPFYGMPSPAPAIFTVSLSGLTQTVSINKLGMITVGAMS